MPGTHNVLNCLAALALADELEGRRSRSRPRRSQSFEGVAAALHGAGRGAGGDRGRRLRPPSRRDHRTLEAAQQAFERRVVAVFQPHRYTRTKLLTEEFERAFNRRGPARRSAHLRGRRAADRRRLRPSRWPRASGSTAIEVVESVDEPGGGAGLAAMLGRRRRRRRRHPRRGQRQPGGRSPSWRSARRGD